jgi:ribosomal protein S27AE
MRDPAEEWRQLHALYAEMGDTELLELRRDFGDLTVMAQGELRDELKQRQLWDMPLPQTEPADAGHADSQTAYDSFGDLLLGGVTVGEYDTVKEANLAVYVLDLGGIGAVVGDGSRQFDLRLPFVRVAPEDAERATGILAQPISAQVRADFEATQNLPDFEVPACPRCSCTEVLLEKVEPTNKWLCGECDHRWQDAAPEGARDGEG